MIRLTELRLPLNHPEDALRAAVLARLGIADVALKAMHVFRRGYDARKPQAIMLVYTLDVDVSDEAALLARHIGDQRIGPAPDTVYRFVARAPDGMRRPVVVGTGPCGFMAALLLAQMGFRPLILERGKVVRERTKDTWGLWRRGVLNPESNVQYGEGGAGTFPMASSIAKSATRAITGARCWPNSSRLGRLRRFSMSPSRISARFGWFPWWSISARRSKPWVVNTALARGWMT